MYTESRAIASHLATLLSMVEKINPIVAIAKNGIPTVKTVFDMVKVPKNDGTPVTAKALKVLDPKILPNAIE